MYIGKKAADIVSLQWPVTNPLGHETEGNGYGTEHDEEDLKPQEQGALVIQSHDEGIRPAGTSKQNKGDC